MSKARWSSTDFKNNGLVEVNGVFVKADKLVAKGKVEKIEPSANRKIQNATKSVVDGVKFDSNLEKYMYGLLQGAGVTFDFQKEYELQPGFRYRGEAVRAIKKIVDFWLPEHNMIVDTKGFANDVAPMKHKMLKSVLKHLQDSEPVIELPATKKECDLLLNKILYDTQ